MTRGRDRAVAAAAVLVLLVLGVALGALLREAEGNAIRSRKDLRLDQARQLARSMDARILQAYAAIGGIAEPQGSWNLTPGDPADAARLASRVAPTGRAGIYVVDRSRIVVNGVLLRDPAAIGRAGPTGLAKVLGGSSVITPVGAGLTTSSPAIGLAVPIRDARGQVVGALVFESEVAADSNFNREVTGLQTGRTGRYSFVDQRGTALASSDDALLARPLGLPDDALQPGFHRTGEQVTGVATVPSAEWRVVFQQSKEEFEGDLTGPLGRALVLLVGAGAVAGAVAVVSLLRRLAAAREEHRRLAEIADAREEFTSIVSHELRTPVAGLLGFLETTVDHWHEMDDDARERAVRRAYGNARTLRSLTADVLDVSAIDAGALSVHPEPVDLQAVVADAVATSRDADPERPVTITAPGDGVTVVIDRVRIGQVIANLLDNAAKSSPAASPIEVTLSVETSRCTVAVRDHGNGIAAEDRERIFERFARRRASGRGSGLGLHIARTLVEAHGGTIRADDAPGGGACVSFTLPLAPPYQAARPAAAPGDRL